MRFIWVASEVTPKWDAGSTPMLLPPGDCATAFASNWLRRRRPQNREERGWSLDARVFFFANNSWGEFSLFLTNLTRRN
jgi:hypothetical protein